ncbi:hypothetical protein [Kitasatospora camelliae]|uniref:Zinc ribbon protein n=1 Tax=Kitasatospora camelliae TaxID=3156397 RepID=A0AAU8JS89_9ACTN
MNYCTPCRRHLNGALSCPGCGAAATAYVPVPSAATTAVAPAETAPGSRRRKPARSGRRRLAVLTAAGLALGGAGVLALAAPEGVGSTSPTAAETPDQGAVQSLPTLPGPSASPSGVPTAKPTKSGSPRPGPSTAAPTTTAPTTGAGPSTAAPTAPAPKPTSAHPTRTTSPSPTQTCKPFLFWCT